MVFSKSILLALGLPALVRGTQYTLIKEYAGTRFFDGWDFFGNCESRCVTRFTPSLALKRRMSQSTTSPTATRCMCVFSEAECFIHPRSDHRAASPLFSFSFVLFYTSQLRKRVPSRVPTARVRQPCGKCDHEGRQYDDHSTRLKARYGTHRVQGSLCCRQRVDRGHAACPIRGR